MPNDLQNHNPAEVNIDEYLEAWNEENEVTDEEEESDPSVEKPEKEADGMDDNIESEPEEKEPEKTGEANVDEPPATDEEPATSEEDQKNDGTESTGDPASEETPQKKEETPAEDGKKKAFEEKIAADISEINKTYPDVKDLKDVGDVKAYIALTVVGGKTPLEAYELLNKTAQQPSKKIKEVGASKAHLKSSVPKGASEESGALTDRQVRELAEDLGISEKEVRHYYRRINT